MRNLNTLHEMLKLQKDLDALERQISIAEDHNDQQHRKECARELAILKAKLERLFKD